MNRIVALCATSLALVAVPSTASAADTLAVEGCVLTYTADPGAPDGLGLYLSTAVGRSASRPGRAGTGGPERPVELGTGCVKPSRRTMPACSLAGASRVVVRGTPVADRLMLETWHGDDQIGLPASASARGRGRASRPSTASTRRCTATSSARGGARFVARFEAGSTRLSRPFVIDRIVRR